MRAVISSNLAKILANPESRRHLGRLLANGDYGSRIEVDGQYYRLQRVEGLRSSQGRLDQHQPSERNTKQTN